jgi:hypothetical protein
MSAGAFFVGGKGAGLSGSATHDDENIHPCAALGAFYLRKSGRMLALMASADHHLLSPLSQFPHKQVNSIADQKSQRI